MKRKIELRRASFRALAEIEQSRGAKKDSGCVTNECSCANITVGGDEGCDRAVN